MALANNRPVSQLPVHSPHTEFNEISLNSESKIRLSPSQIQDKNVKNMSKSVLVREEPMMEDQESPDSGQATTDTNNDSATSPMSSLGPSRSPSANPPSVSLPLEAGKKKQSGEKPADKPKRKYNINPDKQKANKANKINVAATGISTTIPVTGERPMPEKDSSLEDDVLFTIFLILYEHDSAGKGMTVKQICDVLLEKHPETAKLSSKTSNLVSAKLNAYVKRVEKGEKNLKYALSREWADTSPKRMVYVYRGILTSDFYVHAIAAMKNLEEHFEESHQSLSGGRAGSFVETDGGAFDIKKIRTMSVSSDAKLHPTKKKSSVSDPNAENAMDTTANSSAILAMKISSNLFNNSSDSRIDLRITPLTIPYNADVVTTQLDPSISNVSSVSTADSSHLDRMYESPAVSDYDFDDLDSFDDDDEDEEEDEDEDESKSCKRKDKRSNSGSLKYPGKLVKRMKNITAAAAAPRVPKNISNAPSPSIVMAAAASLRAAALHALSPSGSKTGITDPSKEEPHSHTVSTRWLQTVKEGFLTQEIGTPEDISLAELDSLFN